MAKLHIHPVGFLLMLLGIACWVIALGGLAASTKFCNDKLEEGANLLSCSSQYQQDWWALFFELFLLCAMIGTCFLNLFQRARYVYLPYLCMATALLTFTTRTFFTKSFDLGTIDLQDYTSDAFNAAAVGSMFLCIVNFALIIFIGLGAAKAPEPAPATFSSVPTTGPSSGIGVSADGKTYGQTATF